MPRPKLVARVRIESRDVVLTIDVFDPEALQYLPIKVIAELRATSESGTAFGAKQRGEEMAELPAFVRDNPWIDVLQRRGRE